MFQYLSHYEAAKPALWQGRHDTQTAQRFFQKIQFIQEESELIEAQASTVFLGFASDTGVSRNEGRPGARFGADAIKSQLAKLPYSGESNLIDLGNIGCENDDLETAQAQFAEIIHFCHQNGHNTIALGGGHEIAWAHYQGLCKHYPKLGIINFDAHFDLRPHQTGSLGTSGTPFSQIAASCADNQQSFDYCCLGIQSCGNTNSLFQRAKELGVLYLTAEDLNQQSQAWQLAFLDDFMLRVNHIYLTLCLDVLAESYAPGVSAPQPLGLTPWQILPLLKYIMQSGKVVSLDIAELSPPFDKEQKTARLAAQFIAELYS